MKSSDPFMLSIFDASMSSTSTLIEEGLGISQKNE